MIGFENSHLTLREDEGSVNVCTVLSGTLEKTIEVTIYTKNDTATGDAFYFAFLVFVLHSETLGVSMTRIVYT